jgi:hypothetical protein
MSYQNPFVLFDFDDAITHRESADWVKRSFARLTEEYDLGSAPLTAKHKKLLAASFTAGAEFELIRLSRATAVNFHGLPAKVITDGGKLWVKNVSRSKTNSCSLDTWKNVLQNSFSTGAEFVRHYLFPPKARR